MSATKRIFAALLALMLMLSLAGCGEAESTGEALLRPLEENGSGSSLGSTKLVEVTTGSIARSYSPEVSIVFEAHDIVCDLSGAYFIESFVSANDEVEVGDPIARFRVDYSEAELARLEAELTIAKSSAARRKASADESVETAEAALDAADSSDARGYRRAELTLEQAKLNRDAAYASADASVANAEKALADYNEFISEDTIYSDVSGIVSTVEFMTEGTQVGYGRRLCSIMSYADISLDCDANVAAAARHGQPATVTTNLFEGEIAATVVDAPIGRGEELGVFSLKLDEEILREASRVAMENPRAFGTVSVKMERFRVDDVTVVPTDALQSENGIFYVQVLRDGELRKRYVEIGLSDGENSQVLAGLEPGEQVSLG